MLQMANTIGSGAQLARLEHKCSAVRPLNARLVPRLFRRSQVSRAVSKKITLRWSGLTFTTARAGDEASPWRPPVMLMTSLCGYSIL